MYIYVTRYPYNYEMEILIDINAEFKKNNERKKNHYLKRCINILYLSCYMSSDKLKLYMYCICLDNTCSFTSTIYILSLFL